MEKKQYFIDFYHKVVLFFKKTLVLIESSCLQTLENTIWKGTFFMISSLQQHPLFASMSKEDIEILFSCFHFHTRKFQKDEYIIMEGDPIQQVGLILSGEILMEKEDYYGNNYFFMELRKWELFAETFMGDRIQKSTVNYRALSPSKILFFEYQTLWQPCEKHCRCHIVFTENLMNLLALKTRTLLAKIELLSIKSLRDRILSFLFLFSNNGKQHEFLVPMNQTEIAEFLCVNRSALARELSRMKQDGILNYQRGNFQIFGEFPRK